MQLILEIPDFVAAELVANGHDIAREALEALAMQGYRNNVLSENEIRLMLGFETRMQVHEVMKRHDVFYEMTLEEVERDAENSRLFRERQATARANAA